jgi:hypothetical protein
LAIKGNPLGWTNHAFRIYRWGTGTIINFSKEAVCYSVETENPKLSVWGSRENQKSLTRE